jgi:hypothetical protein
MLLQLIVNQPQAVGTILKNTPVWVWGLLTGLLALGFSQVRARTASLTRVAAVPVLMTGFAIWGIGSAFGASGQMVWVMLAWLAAAAVVAAILAPGAAAQGTSYDRATRTYALPGTFVPLLLIVGIFLTKYAVGVELAMQPKLAQDATFAIEIAALYGVFNGFFTGRAIRLLRLAR